MRLALLDLRRAEVAQLIADDCVALLDGIERAQLAVDVGEEAVYIEEVAHIIDELDLMTESWI